MKKKNSPAINFYSSDFLTGTTFFSNKEVGGYLRLLLYQHQLGHLNIEMINQVLNDFNENEREKVLSKFELDNNGNYYNKRMQEEINKKNKYSESRSINRKNSNKSSEKNGKDMNNICLTYEKDSSNISETYEEHMENEIENTTTNINNYKIFNYIEDNLNITISGNNYELIEEYLKIFNDEILCYAIDRTIANGVSNLNYFFKILESWSQKKYKTLEEIKEKDKRPITKEKETIDEKFERLKKEGRI